MTELFRIKPLEWERVNRGNPFWVARPLPDIQYQVGWVGGVLPIRWLKVGVRDADGRCASPEEGKQLAEQHWQEYIKQAARTYGDRIMTEQEHLLICLMEECGEVIQACSKALRFGLDDDHQALNPEIVSPRLYLRKELNDLAAVADLFQADWMDETLIDAKKNKLSSFMQYARSKGTLEKDHNHD